MMLFCGGLLVVCAPHQRVAAHIHMATLSIRECPPLCHQTALVSITHILPPPFLSSTHQSLEFEGIMRFYFQSLGEDGQKVATKCIRVSNTATTEMVIEALVQKFRPDMRMLTHQSSYALYEVHTDEGTGMCVTGSFCALR